MFGGRHEIKKIDDQVFIDRDAVSFRYLLNQLRSDLEMPVIVDKYEKKQLDIELDFWGFNDDKIKLESEFQNLFEKKPDVLKT